MKEIDANMVRQALTDPDPVLEALSLLLKSVAADAVEILASTLAMIGHDPTQLPAEFFLQAIMIEAEKVFRTIDRQKWIDIYDSYQQVKALVASDPVLQAEVAQSKAETPARLRAAKHQQAMGLKDRRSTFTGTQPEPVNSDGFLDGDF